MGLQVESPSSEQQPRSSDGSPVKSPKKSNRFSLGKILVFWGIAILAVVLVTSLVRSNSNSPTPANEARNEPIDTFTDTPLVILTDTPLPTVTMVSDGTSVVSEDGFVEPTATELDNFAAETDALLATMEEEKLPAKSGDIFIFSPESEKSIKLRARFERFIDLAAHGYYPIFSTRSFALETQLKGQEDGFDLNISPIHPDNLRAVKNIVYVRRGISNDSTLTLWGDDPKDISPNLIGPTPFRSLMFGRDINQWTASADWQKAKVFQKMPTGSDRVSKTFFEGGVSDMKLWPRVSLIWIIAPDDTLHDFMDRNEDWYNPDYLRGFAYPVILDY